MSHPDAAEINAIPLFEPLSQPWVDQLGSRAIVRWQPGEWCHGEPPLSPPSLSQAYLLDAPDGGRGENAPPFSVNDWLGWIEAHANDGPPDPRPRARHPSSRVTWHDWPAACRQLDLEAIARWLREDQNDPTRDTAHQARGLSLLRAVLKASLWPPEASDVQPADRHRWSIEAQRQEVLIGLLLAMGAPPDHGDLFEAVAHPNPRLLQRLLAARPLDRPWDFAREGIVTPLEAASSNHWSTVEDIVDVLVAAGVPLDRPGMGSAGALRAAIDHSNRRLVRRLILEGADVDQEAWGRNLPKNLDHPLPLHLAASQNDPVIVDLLLAAGAGVNAASSVSLTVQTSRHGFRRLPVTALVQAAVDGRDQSVERLLAHGAKVATNPDDPESSRADVVRLAREHLGYLEGKAQSPQGKNVNLVAARACVAMLEQAALCETLHEEARATPPWPRLSRPRL